MSHRVAPRGRLRRWVIRRLGGFIEQEVEETAVVSNYITGAQSHPIEVDFSKPVLLVGSVIRRSQDRRWSITPGTVIQVGMLAGMGDLLVEGCIFNAPKPE